MASKVFINPLVGVDVAGGCVMAAGGLICLLPRLIPQRVLGRASNTQEAKKNPKRPAGRCRSFVNSGGGHAIADWLDHRWIESHARRDAEFAVKRLRRCRRGTRTPRRDATRASSRAPQAPQR